MKDGSFEHNLNSIDLEDDFEIKNTPLPSEMPSHLDFDEITTSKTKSGAIDALMSQNEDLMSRLGVALRRISNLEDELDSSHSDNQSFKSKYESLKDQLLVFKEKARMINERNNKDQFEETKLKEQLQLLEIRYAELYQNFQAKDSKSRVEKSQSELELSRLRRYRQRIQKVAKSLQLKFRSTAQSHKQLSDKLTGKEAQLETLKKNLLETTEHIQKQGREFELENKQSQKAIDEKTQKVSELEGQLSLQSAELESLNKEKIEIENDSVLLERRFEDYKLKSSTEVSDLQSGLSRYRNESKELAIENEELKSELEDNGSRIVDLNKQLFTMTEQVENLQALWREQQRKLEKHVEKNASLQKLNQELSVTINQYRRDLRETRERLDQNSINDGANKEGSSSNTEKPEIVEKIDQALGQLL